MDYCEGRGDLVALGGYLASEVRLNGDTGKAWNGQMLRDTYLGRSLGMSWIAAFLTTVAPLNGDGKHLGRI